MVGVSAMFEFGEKRARDLGVARWCEGCREEE